MEDGASATAANQESEEKSDDPVQEEFSEVSKAEEETPAVEKVKDNAEQEKSAEEKDVSENGPKSQGQSETTQQDEDSINIMIGEEEVNFDEEPSEKNGAAASPPRPETAPVVRPFTSKDTISLHSQNKAHSENSSMLVNPDDESVGAQEVDEKKGGGAAAAAEGEKKKVESPAKEEEKPSNNRNLWVCGLASSTKATDLKALFSKHGKVVGAKVVTNARTPGARCYGYVTMDTAEEATKCMENLNKTELQGKTIIVERAQNRRPKEQEQRQDRFGGEELARKGRGQGGGQAAGQQRFREGKRQQTKRRQRSQGQQAPWGVQEGKRTIAGGRITRGEEGLPWPGWKGETGRTSRPEGRTSPPDLASSPLPRYEMRETAEKEREEERRRRERDRRKEEEEERRRREQERRRQNEEEKLRREKGGNPKGEREAGKREGRTFEV